MIKKIEENLREFVYGGMDGAVTTFAVVTGAAGARLDTTVILILGFANVLADGFSMAVGSYLSEKSDQDLSNVKGDTTAEDHESPLAASIATFLSFIIVGFIPLSLYTIDYVLSLGIETNTLLISSVALTLLAFVGIGYLRAHITKISRGRAVLESFGLGAAAAVISFGVGNILERVIS